MIPPPRTRILNAFLALGLCLATLRPAAALAVPVIKAHDLPNFAGTLKFAPDGRLFFLETFTGRVMFFPDTTAFSFQQWATIPVVHTVENGLLGMAFHPQFPDSPYVYFFHTNPNPYFNRVVRMTDSAGIGTHYTVIFDSLACNSETHEGGRLAFGPDRMLYVTVGDQYVPANSQDITTPLGKILRLTPMGRPAPGNPFGPLNPAVAFGIRNSYGICFDPLDGYGYFTENGPTCDDELNFFQFAANYGWGPDDLCGSQPEGTLLPMWTISPTTAPTGVCVYRGSLMLSYDGNVFFTSFNHYILRRAILQPGRPDVVNSVTVIADFGEPALDVTEGPDEHLWVVTASAVWRIGPPLVSTDSPRSPVLAWRPGPSPFTNRLALAARGGEQLRRIEVLDVTGRRLRTFDGPFNSSVTWDGRDEAGRPLPAGVYLIRAETSAGPVTRTVVRLAR